MLYTLGYAVAFLTAQRRCDAHGRPGGFPPSTLRANTDASRHTLKPCLALALLATPEPSSPPALLYS